MSVGFLSCRQLAEAARVRGAGILAGVLLSQGDKRDACATLCDRRAEKANPSRHGIDAEVGCQRLGNVVEAVPYAE